MDNKAPSFAMILGWLMCNRVIEPELAKVLIPAFLNAEYQGNKVGGERLARRVEKIHKLEDAERK